VPYAVLAELSGAAVLWEAPHAASSAAVKLAPSQARSARGAPVFLLLTFPPLFMGADNSPIAGRPTDRLGPGKCLAPAD